jgi:hypothetical protein
MYKGKGHRLCGLEVRVPGFRPRGPELDSQRYQIFFVPVSGAESTQIREDECGATSKK